MDDLDLAKALRDAARSGTAHRAALDAAPVLQRIRRRRTLRHAVEGTVGVAAVGIVALGAVQVTALRDPGPLAPVTTATPTRTPTPTPSATDEAPVRWDAVAAAGAFACGAAVPDVEDPPGGADLRFEPVVMTKADPRPSVGGDPRLTLLPGDPVSVDALLVNGTDQELDAVATGPAQVWFVQGSTVVGQLDVVDPPTGSGAEYVGGPGTTFSVEQALGVPVGCTNDGAGGDPLPPADYDAYVVQDLRLPDDATVVVTGEPVPVRVAEPAAPGVDPHPDVTELVVSTAGLGPLAIGAPPVGNPGAAMIVWDPDACEMEPGDEPGRWVASGYPEGETANGPRVPFTVAADDTTVSWIDVWSPAVRTAEGVGLGTTLADLQATYPQLEGPFDGPTSRVWWLTGPTGTLVFETQDDALGLQPAGTPETVILVRVLQAGLDPQWATANSDFLAGGCL